MEQPKSGARHFPDLDIYVSCLALAVLICITVSGVFMRYLINRPFYWLEEVQLWCFVWAVFAGTTYVARKNSHIAIDAIVTLFPAGARRAAATLGNIATVVVLSFLGYYSCFHVMQMYTRNRFTNILSIPYWFIYLVVPISCLVIVLSTLRRMVSPGQQEVEQQEQA